jgi:glycosyltransferase involved in cell wall biosynthesis
MNFMAKLFDLLKKVRVWGLTGICEYVLRNFSWAVHRRRLMKLHKESKVKVPQPGITVIGDLTERPAVSKTLRDFVLNLKDAGIPVQTYNTRLKSDIPKADADQVLTPLKDFDLHRYTHIVMMFRSPLTKEMALGHRVARIVFYESEHGIHETTPFLRESGDEIIAMSDFNYRYFVRAFPDRKVWKITYPFRFKSGEVQAKRGDKFTVFFNFDFGSYWRKNATAALKAFGLAFGGDETARLVFKTKGAKKNRQQVRDLERCVHELGLERQFVHISDYISREELDNLYGEVDVYISLHKCEGFGLGMAEAMSQGKCVVATDWSANTEFCRPDTAWCVPYRMVPILPHEYPPAMKEWAEADVNEAARMLKEIRRDPEEARKRAQRGQAFVRSAYSLARFKSDIERFME